MPPQPKRERALSGSNPPDRRSPRARDIFFATGLAAALLLTAGCGGDSEDGGRDGERGERAAAARTKGKGARGLQDRGGGAAPVVPVIAGYADVGDMEAFLDGSATLEAESAVDVVSQATGVVASFEVEEGDRVERGDTLARLDYEDLDLAERRARSELDRLEADFARAEKLKTEQFISEEDFQAKKYDLERARIDWETAKLALERARIEAPLSGTVTAREINVGQLVRENDVVYRIVDFDSLIAPVFVPEKYLAELREGQPVLVNLPSTGAETVGGRIERIAPTVDEQSGTVRVVVGLERSRALRPGMYARVQIVLDRHEDVVVVPKKALVYDDERPFVFTVSEGVASRRPVTLGYEDERRVEVADGIAEGDLVVLVGQSTLKDGSAVRAESETGELLDAPPVRGSDAPAAEPTTASAPTARKAAGVAGAGS